MLMQWSQVVTSLYSISIEDDIYGNVVSFVKVFSFGMGEIKRIYVNRHLVKDLCINLYLTFD